MISEFFGKALTPTCLLVLVLCPAMLSAHASEPPKNALKAVAAVNLKAPDFALVDQDNQRFDSARLRGKITALDFIFTTCTDVCPIFTANLAQIQRKIRILLVRLLASRSPGNATLAQLVERLIRNQQVSGSSPEGGSKLIQNKKLPLRKKLLPRPVSLSVSL